jgi:hypothetical protein
MAGEPLFPAVTVLGNRLALISPMVFPSRCNFSFAVHKTCRPFPPTIFFTPLSSPPSTSRSPFIISPLRLPLIAVAIAVSNATPLRCSSSSPVPNASLLLSPLAAIRSASASVSLILEVTRYAIPYSAYGRAPPASSRFPALLLSCSCLPRRTLSFELTPSVPRLSQQELLAIAYCKISLQEPCRKAGLPLSGHSHHAASPFATLVFLW